MPSRKVFIPPTPKLTPQKRSWSPRGCSFSSSMLLSIFPQEEALPYDCSLKMF